MVVAGGEPMRRLPHSLDVIRVAEPCPQSWDAMTGDTRARYCAGCHKHVYDLSAMSRSEAEKLVCESAGGMCVRFSRAADGRVRTLDYQPSTGGRRGWRFWALASACFGSLTAAAGGILFARGRAVPPPSVVGALVETPQAAPSAAPVAPDGPMMMGFIIASPRPVPPTPPAP
jgi:hypothetical protein